jgi:hypothetical protein
MEMSKVCKEIKLLLCPDVYIFSLPALRWYPLMASKRHLVMRFLKVAGKIVSISLILGEIGFIHGGQIPGQ